MKSIVLEAEQVRALEILVEASRAQPSNERQPFRGMKDYTTSKERLLVPSRTGLPADFPGFYPGDLEQLASEDLLNLETSPRDTWTFAVTPRGYRYYEWLKQREGQPVARIEQSVRSYVDATGFAQRHPIAWQKWTAAEQHLWAADSVQSGTTVGHLCREAHQEFASSLLARHPVADADADKQKTQKRLRAVLAALPKRSEKVDAVATALVDYWSAVTDLAQRQEHGGLKEGEALVWEDARRLVFATLFAMTELDRSIEAST